MATKSRCTPEVFVRAWLDSASIAEVAQRTGYAKNTVPIVALRLRRAGVKLPSMRGRMVRIADVAALNAIIEEARSGDRKR